MTATISDFGQFTSLRASAERNDPEALREVASQFEALFVQSLLKNMRGAQLAEPMFGSEQMDMYQDMFDQQLSLEMANGRGIGLADMLVRQLGGEGEAPAASGRSFALPAIRGGDPVAEHTTGWSAPDEFVRDIWPHAERAAQALGVAPQAIVAQAALETGWGAHVMRRGDGETSYNLFGIKAGASWDGATATRPTLEYEGGVAKRTVAQFRAYPDLAATFDDYVRFVSEQSRYAEVGGQGDDVAGFAGALQRAGYATDPQYARKIDRVARSETMQNALYALKISAPAPITVAGTSAEAD